MPIRLKLVLGRFTVAIIGVFSLAVMTSARTSSAADRPTQKINVAYSSISGNVSPLWVTQDKGFFRKYGLEVQSILIESGTTTAQALVAERYQLRLGRWPGSDSKQPARRRRRHDRRDY